jgi:hypothetical protein
LRACGLVPWWDGVVETHFRVPDTNSMKVSSPSSGLYAHAQLAHSQLAHWQSAHWPLSVARVPQAQLVHSQLAQPQSDPWVVADDEPAACMLVEEGVISGLQRVGEALILGV